MIHISLDGLSVSLFLLKIKSHISAIKRKVCNKEETAKWRTRNARLYFVLVQNKYDSRHMYLDNYDSRSAVVRKCHRNVFGSYASRSYICAS